MHKIETQLQLNNKSISSKYSIREEQYEYILTLFMLFGELITLYNDIMPSAIRQGIVLVWFFISVVFLESRGKLRQFLYISGPVIILFITMFIRLFISYDKITDNGFHSYKKAMNCVYVLLYGLLFPQVIMEFSKDRREKLIIILIIALTLTILPSLIYLRETPNCIRDAYDLYAIVSFTFIYGMIPLFLISIGIFKYANNKYKLLFLPFFIIYFLLVSKANFATALLLTVVFSILTILFSRNGRIETLALGILVLIIIFLICRKEIANVAYYFSKYEGFSPIMQKRMLDIGDLLAGKNLGRSFTARIDLMKRSWNSFLTAPIFGLPFEKMNLTTMGFHETWISLLAYGGLFGFICVVLSLFRIFKYVFSNMSSYKFRQIYIIAITMFFVLSFLNPIFMKTNLFVMLGIVPICDMFFDDDKIFTNKRMLKRAHMVMNNEKNCSSK